VGVAVGVSVGSGMKGVGSSMTMPETIVLSCCSGESSKRRKRPDCGKATMINPVAEMQIRTANKAPNMVNPIDPFLLFCSSIFIPIGAIILPCWGFMGNLSRILRQYSHKHNNILLEWE
jgi:hypothetical protein